MQGFGVIGFDFCIPEPYEEFAVMVFQRYQSKVPEEPLGWEGGKSDIGTM